MDKLAKTLDELDKIQQKLFDLEKNLEYCNVFDIQSEESITRRNLTTIRSTVHHEITRLKNLIKIVG